MISRIREIPLLVACAAAAALMPLSCALTSKAEIVGVRYFSPEPVKPRSNNLGPVGANAQPLQLRLGRVSSGPNLRERIAYRSNTYEAGYYEDFRWTERPETFLRRQLGLSLFEARGVIRAVGAVAPTLDVELIVFDELRLQEGRAVRIQLKLTLYQSDVVLLEETLTLERSVLGENPRIEDIVAAMSAALDAVAQEVAVKVVRVLAARRLQTANEPTL